MSAATAKRTDSERWDKCKQIQHILLDQKVCEVSATDVNKYLYDALVKAGMIHEDSKWVSLDVSSVQQLLQYQQMIEARRAKASRPKVYKPKKKVYTEEIIDGPADQIRVAMWLIKKVGSVDQARKAIEPATAALDKLK